MKYLQYEEHDMIGFLTINRPEALNALNSGVVAEVTAQIDVISKSKIRCLIITGAGKKSFVAGADIAEMKDLNPKQSMIFSDEGNVMMEKIENLPFPVIAAVNGYALGGGCEVALSCDLRIASDNAIFSLPETGLGITPGYGGMQRLGRLLGIAKAKEMVYTGVTINAQEALRLGLVNAVCTQDELLAQATQLAAKIASKAPVAIRVAKQVMNDNVGKTLHESYRLERQGFGECFATEDQKMAMT
ncbi:MAG: enoyl-CoA hydratase/isomerase family protein, partial [Saezia sp.]